MAGQVVQRLAAAASATGSITAASFYGAMPALVVAFIAVLLAGIWVLSDNARTNRLVRVISAVKGPAAAVSSHKAVPEPRSRASR